MYIKGILPARSVAIIAVDILYYVDCDNCWSRQ